MNREEAYISHHRFDVKMVFLLQISLTPSQICASQHPMRVKSYEAISCMYRLSDQLLWLGTNLATANLSSLHTLRYNPSLCLSHVPTKQTACLVLNSNVSFTISAQPFERLLKTPDTVSNNSQFQYPKIINTRRLRWLRELDITQETQRSNNK